MSDWIITLAPYMSSSSRWLAKPRWLKDFWRWHRHWHLTPMMMSLTSDHVGPTLRIRALMRSGSLHNPTPFKSYDNNQGLCHLVREGSSNTRFSLPKFKPELLVISYHIFSIIRCAFAHNERIVKTRNHRKSFHKSLAQTRLSQIELAMSFAFG